MANERNNEFLVRNELQKLGYYESEDLTVEEQQSKVASIKRLLRAAAKSGSGNHGHPEFIVTSVLDDDVVLIIECKADSSQHESPLHEKPVTHAVDGALHYASFLSKEFHVVAIGSSGETLRDWRISTYLFAKGADAPVRLNARSGHAIKSIVPWADYRDAFTYDPDVKNRRIEDLLAVSRSMHNFMRDYAKLTENEKPLLVSGTLIALMNAPFRASYSEHKPETLQNAWLTAITAEIDQAEIPRAKKNNITQPYSGIAVHPELGRAALPKYPKGPLHELVRLLDHEVMPLMDVYHDYDVVGQFYGEFLKYTGGDKKALGIVLTPRHITDLFARLAQVSKDDIVVDICAGTGGFLIASMSRMLDQCVTEEQRNDVRRNRLLGIENQPNMYTLAASNMLLRGDGKANLYQGSCFDEPNKRAIVEHARGGESASSLRPTIGMLNPPYSQRGEGLHELDFVAAMLDVVAPGGLGFAIVPVSCATGSYGKRELLASHRLEAVMSMPPELFSPVGVVTCVMVFRAHRPHANTPDFKTWFGYWREDGFIKTKHKGRIDGGGWQIIRDNWVNSFVNREVRRGESVVHRVEENDEWTAEAYLETDYSKLTREDFERVVMDYALFMLKRDYTSSDLGDLEEEGLTEEDAQ